MSRLDYVVRADRAPPAHSLCPQRLHVLPGHVVESKSSLPDLTNTPVLSANTTLEKSTIFMRDTKL
jgi:hypothetical protein